MSANPAASVLLWPFEQGLLPKLGNTRCVLFQNAQTVPGLQHLASMPIVGVQQHADQLDLFHGHSVPLLQAEANTIDFALFLPDRQRAQTRGQLVRLLNCLKPEGTLLVALANDWGARSIESDLQALAGNIASVSKNKCRIFWATKQQMDATLAAQWLADEQARLVDFDGVQLWSKPGVFSWASLDRGTRVLINHLPNDLSGRCADLGAGLGHLGFAMLRNNSAITTLDCYEANYEALQLCEKNLRAAHRNSSTLSFHWHDVRKSLDKEFDVIVSNPPFHQGRADAPELGQQFIETASEALVEGGRLIIVANRHLPYEKLLKEKFKTGFHLADEDGFKVIEAIK
jgi:16S rRNA (guanine1207-N2)-methyltransferase